MRTASRRDDDAVNLKPPSGRYPDDRKSHGSARSIFCVNLISSTRKGSRYQSCSSSIAQIDLV
eukprot:scaffold89280_cov26-Phaeocystis_antarctica.AAC.1